MIAIVDLGIGNHANISRATGGKITSDPDEISRSDKIIIPGVGSATSVARKFHELKYPIRDRVDDGIPVLGICLGMQLLTDLSCEGGVQGLGIFRGKADKFSHGAKNHIGWNTIRKVREHDLIYNIPQDSFFYFVHSFRVYIESEYVVASTEFNGESFPAVIVKENVMGTQFHPEKSSYFGRQVLQNFAKMGVIV